MTRQLSDQELRLWLRVARTAKPLHSTPLHGAESEAEIASPKATIRTAGPSAVSEAARKQVSTKTSAPAADQSGHRRIRRGQVEIDASIDLHGYTQDQARGTLCDFVLRQRMSGARCLLVITGKGRAGTGVLRRRFLDWINDPDIRPHLAGYSVASARHGGEGAFYLLLKRPRPA